MDRRQMTFEQTQTKKPKSKKLKVRKVLKQRCPGTTAAAKQKKLNRVNRTFMKLEADCKNLLRINAQLEKDCSNLLKELGAVRAGNQELFDANKELIEKFKITQAEADALRAENEYE